MWNVIVLCLVLSIADGIPIEGNEGTGNIRETRGIKKGHHGSPQVNPLDTEGIRELNKTNSFITMERFLGNLTALDALPLESGETPLREEWKGAIDECQKTTACVKEYLDKETQMEQAAQGLEAITSVAATLTEFFSPLVDEPNLKDIGVRLAKSIAPLLGAIAPMIMLFSLFEDTPEVQRLDKLLKVVDVGFMKMDSRFDAIETQIVALGDLILQKHLEASLSDDLKFIYITSEYLQTYYKEMEKCLNGTCIKTANGTTSAELKASRAELDQHTYSELYIKLNSIKQAFYGVGGYNRDTSICSVSIKTSHTDRKDVLKTSIHYFTKMIIGAQNYLAIGELLKKGKHNQQVLVDMLTGASDNITACDERIRTVSWLSAWKEDVKGVVKKYARKHQSPANVGKQICKFITGYWTTGSRKPSYINVTGTTTEKACIDECIAKRDAKVGGQINGVQGVTMFVDTQKQGCMCAKSIKEITTNSSSDTKTCLLIDEWEELANFIYTKLTTKYTWREWFVFVTGNMGDDLKTMNVDVRARTKVLVYKKTRFHVIVSSVEKNSTKIDINWDVSWISKHNASTAVNSVRDIAPAFDVVIAIKTSTIDDWARSTPINSHTSVKTSKEDGYKYEGVYMKNEYTVYGFGSSNVDSTDTTGSED